MGIEKGEEFLFARHQSLEKAQHWGPRFGPLLAMPACRRQAEGNLCENTNKYK
jgi:hypothetical protein